MSGGRYSIDLEDRDRFNGELGGGLPAGSIVLVEGAYGAGKSVLSQRIAYGCCEAGHPVTLLSTEQSVPGFIEQMHSLEYDVTEHLLDDRLLYLHAPLETPGATPQREGDRSQREAYLDRLMAADRMWDADVIVIDTFDAILRKDPTFEALVRGDDGRRGALEIISFFRDVAASGRTVVLTVDQTAVDEDGLRPFRSIADVYLTLEIIEVGNEERRQLSVRRFAGNGEHVGKSIGYSIRAGTGVVIESRSVA